MTLVPETTLPAPIVALTVSPIVFFAAEPEPAIEIEITATDTLTAAATGVAVIEDDSLAVTFTSPPVEVTVEAQCSPGRRQPT